MIQSDKELLLKDLCARLPYHVIVTTIKDIDTDEDLGHGKYKQSKFTGYISSISSYLISVVDDSIDKVGETSISNIKPYLRPMKSMTDEEKKKVHYFVESHNFGNCSRSGVISDYLNSIHIDYRGLIEKGLALEAPEGMYKTE